MSDAPRKTVGVCKCGHTGDTENSQHMDTALEKGHGKCVVCDCERFTWVGWIDITKKGNSNETGVFS
jgi:hypothetical protein